MITVTFDLMKKGQFKNRPFLVTYRLAHGVTLYSAYTFFSKSMRKAKRETDLAIK